MWLNRALQINRISFYKVISLAFDKQNIIEAH